MKIRKGDKVKVTTGKHKGTVGEVLSVNVKRNAVVIEGVNVKKKALDKKSQTDSAQTENFVYIQHPINASNVRLVDDSGNYLKKRGAVVSTSKKAVKAKAAPKKKTSEKPKKTKGKSK